jgi:hypothetical protein
MKSFYKAKKKAAKDMVESSKHISRFDTVLINHALDRASAYHIVSVTSLIRLLK